MAAVARDLGTSLSDGGTGIAAFAARNLLEQVRASLPELPAGWSDTGEGERAARHFFGATSVSQIAVSTASI